MNKIQAIKLLRTVVPDLSLVMAKAHVDTFESNYDNKYNSGALFAEPTPSVPVVNYGIADFNKFADLRECMDRHSKSVDRAAERKRKAMDRYDLAANDFYEFKDKLPQ